MKRTGISAFLALALLAPLAAQSGSFPGLSRFVLSNGIELFVYRDQAVPIVRVEACVKAGALAQTPETAGYFHLYEHLAFGGDSKSGGSPALRAELAAMGAAEWNGGTSAERMDYWLTLPSSRYAEGLAFWARHLRPETIGQAELQAAREPVLAEVKATLANPASIYEGAMTKRLFGKYPWRRDPAGSEASLAAATPEALIRIRDTYVIPNNLALLVGGDVDPEAVRAAAEAAFAGWKPGEDPWKKALPPHPRPGVARPTWMVYPDPSLPEGMALVELRYRGPDLGADPQASYAADVWTALVAPAAGRYKTAVAKAVPKLLGADPITAYYLAQREGSTLSVSAYLTLDRSVGAVDLARQFKERARGFEVTLMRTEAAYFSQADLEAAKARLEAARRLALETPDGVLDALSWAWATASADYFTGYSQALAKVGKDEVQAFLDTYLMRNLEVIALRLNPADFEAERKSFQGSGFDTVGPANAYWWQK